MTRPLPTVEELATAWVEAKRVHRSHLAPHEVKLPREDSPRRIWLAMLFHYQPNPVHKNEISDAVRRELPDAAPDQQVRHLRSDGWNVEDHAPGLHALADPFRPSPDYANERVRRSGTIAAADFEALKQRYGYRCATCGANEGEPDPRYGSGSVRLQRGHKDPERPADDPMNIIPQCSACNRAYRDDFVFDDRGRVTAVAAVRPVRRASVSVRRKIRDFLNRQAS